MEHTLYPDNPNALGPPCGDPVLLGAPFLGQATKICIVTPSLSSTLDGLVRLGIGPFKVFVLSPGTVSRQKIDGQPAPFEIEVAFAYQGKMVWEVMQPIYGATIMQDFLDNTGGRGGIHHVGFDCGEGGRCPMSTDRVGRQAREEAVRRRRIFESRGFPVAQSGVWHGKSGFCEFMFFRTEGLINTCFESYVFSDDWEDPKADLFPAAA